jgi:uncharacterized protein YeaC (DUF1315 family)
MLKHQGSSISQRRSNSFTAAETGRCFSQDQAVEVGEWPMGGAQHHERRRILLIHIGLWVTPNKVELKCGVLMDDRRRARSRQDGIHVNLELDILPL